MRFIFFSGEEQGLLGSDYYVSQLSKKQIKDISVMLDYDMLASSNYARLHLRRQRRRARLRRPERLRRDRAGVQGLLGQPGPAYETIPFDGRSDYDAFTMAGIPAGGIFAGAEVIKTPEQVALYGGTAGDRVRPVLPPALRHAGQHQQHGLEHKDAAVHAIRTFAQTTSAVNGTGKASSTSTKPCDWKGDQLVR